MACVCCQRPTPCRYRRPFWTIALVHTASRCMGRMTCCRLSESQHHIQLSRRRLLMC
jgi:hypothetical protein